MTRRAWMFLAGLAAAGLLAGPATAATQPCRGEACPVVTPILSNGCWAFHNSGERQVRGIISTGGQILLFEITPRGNTTPRFKSGACLSTAVPYQVDFNANRVEPRRRGGGR